MTAVVPAPTRTRRRIGPGPADSRVATVRLLALWAVLLPFEPEAVWLSVGPVDLRLGQILELAVVASFVAGTLGRRSRPGRGDSPPVPRAVRVTALLFAVVLAVSPLLSSGDRQTMVAMGFRFGLGLAVAAVAAGAVRSREDMMLLTRALATGVVVAAVVGLWAMASGGEAPLTSWLRGSPTRLGLDPRLTRPFPHANLAAVFLAAGLPAVVATTPVKATIPLRWGITVATVALAAGLTYSRPVLLLPVAALVVAAVGAREMSRRWWTAAGLVAAVILAVVLTDPHWRTRILHPGNDGFYAVTVDAPGALTLGTSPETVRVTVTNPGSDTWSTGGADSVQLGIRWQSPDGATQFATETHPLAREIGPGRTVDIEVNLVAPVPAGSYVAVWDLVIDREVWFAESTGSRFVTAVTVTADRVPAGASASQPTPRRAAEVSRPRIWREALAVWAGRPLTGVGTSGFGSVATARLGPDSQRVVHAHDLVLESLADWGVPGGLVLPLLVALTVVSMAAAVRNGLVANHHVWLVGTAAVLVGWSVVEWLLPFSATGGLFWLTGGLWWSVDRRTAVAADV
ncbi:MAG TPA: hypothetical protein ENI86_15755 [Acidimicrobiales bacterium]|nr:hypothetical protein [Acidimicrobiales bacterium]